MAARPFAFDAATDGIISQTAQALTFASSTTGDTDGIDLVLDQAAQGTITFDSQAGLCKVDLAELGAGKAQFDLGGLGMQVSFERYPEYLTDQVASLSAEIEPSTGQTTPYFVKVIQEDGHMAWSSPIYVVG